MVGIVTIVGIATMVVGLGWSLYMLHVLGRPF